MGIIEKTAVLGVSVFFLFLVIGIPSMDSLFLIDLEGISGQHLTLLQWSAYLGFLSSMMYMAVRA